MNLSRLASLVLTLAMVTPGTSARAADITLKPEQVKALGIETVMVQGGANAAVSGHPGRIVVPTAQQRVVAAPLAGLVLSLDVAVGDSVRAGQTLGVLRSPQLNELQRDLLQTRSQEDLTRRARDRDEQLFKEGLIGTARLDASRAAHQQAQAQATERQRMLQLSGARTDLKGTGELVLTSPLTGVVLEAPVTVGQRVEQAAPIVRVGNLATLWLELQVPAAVSDGLKLGDTVRIAGRDVSGKLIKLGQAVDPTTQTVMARAEIKGADASRVRPGLAVEALLEQAGDGLVHIPAGAVTQQAQGSAVFVERSPGQFRLAMVGVRSSSGGTAAVSGLSVGSTIVVRGTAALMSLVKP